MTSRAEKLRRRQHRKDKKRQKEPCPVSWLARPKATVVVNPPGQVKMSEVLMALVEPEWHTCKDEDAMNKLLTLGIIAWNAANLKGAKRTAFLEEMSQSFPIDLRRDFMYVVEPFIRRKEQLFPHILRPMLSFDLTWRPSGEPYLQVVSGLMPE